MDTSQTSGGFIGRSGYLYVYLAFVLPLAVLAFWKEYVSLLGNMPDHVPLVYHLHAVAMTVWIVMLTVQAWLAKTRRFPIHRIIGRTSFILVPLIIILGLSIIHVRQNNTEVAAMPGRAQLQTIAFGMLLAFLITWSLAIRYRRQRSLHMRYMISTVFAISPAIVFRILKLWIPGFETVPAALLGNWILLTLPLLLLIVMDWRQGIKRSPYWVVTLLLALMHLGYWTFAKSDWWLAFCMWFRGL